MTNAETIAEAVREFATLMLEEVKKAKTPDQYEKWMELVSLMRRMARLIAGMSFEDAKQTILEFDDPEKGIIIDLLGKKGIFF